MLNLKKITIAAITVSICAFAGTASAQTAPLILENVQTVKTAEAAPKAMPKLISTPAATRTVKRVVKTVPAQASADMLNRKTMNVGIINADTSGKGTPTKFIYNRSQDVTPARVLFNEASLNSR